MSKTILLVIFFSLLTASLCQAQWEFISPGVGEVFSMTATENTLFLGGSSGILRLTDEGSKWSSLNKGLNNIVVISMVSFANRLFAVTGGSRGVFRSDTGKETWEKIDAGLPSQINKKFSAVRCKC
jgi:photosystem II stability/assembly factor-like uncharacterized protein